jgi:hypothetical protein
VSQLEGYNVVERKEARGTRDKKIKEKGERKANTAGT